MTKLTNKMKVVGIIGIFVVAILALVLYSEIKKPIETQEKTKGILTLNTNKDQYLLGERVSVQITSLDSQGNTLCESNLKLSITNDSQPTTHNNIPISHSPTCDPENNITFSPDYTAYFTPPVEGEYQIKLTNLDSNDSSQTLITVSDDLLDFSLTRWGASRINPYKSDRFPMKLILTANKSFSGKLVEHIPSHLKIIWYGPAKVEKTSDGQTVTWEIDIKAQETKEFTYEYTTPSDKSYNFSLGPAKLVSNGETYFEEKRQWQIVSN